MIQIELFQKRRKLQVGGLSFPQHVRNSDLRAFNAAEVKILSLMSNGDWHTPEEIIEASGQREGMRRLRALRRCYEIECSRDSGQFKYRIKQHG